MAALELSLKSRNSQARILVQQAFPLPSNLTGTSYKSRAAAKRLFQFFIFLVIFPLSQVYLTAGGKGQALVTPALADFSDNCPRDCTCKWANGKREADCTRAGFTAIPTNLVRAWNKICHSMEKFSFYFCRIMKFKFFGWPIISSGL